MLDPRDYYTVEPCEPGHASLEAFSRSLMSLVEYSLDDEGRMTAGIVGEGP